MVHKQLAGVPHARHITVQECSLLRGHQVYYVCYVNKQTEEAHNLLIVHNYYAGVKLLSHVYNIQYLLIVQCTLLYSSAAAIVLVYSIAQSKGYNNTVNISTFIPAKFEISQKNLFLHNYAAI